MDIIERARRAHEQTEVDRRLVSAARLRQLLRENLGIVTGPDDTFTHEGYSCVVRIGGLMFREVDSVIDGTDNLTRRRELKVWRVDGSVFDCGIVRTLSDLGAYLARSTPGADDLPF